MTIKRTITSIFFIPTLKIPKDSLLDNGFINGFVKDIHRDEQYENVVYILFQPTNLYKFREFLDGEYTRTKAIIDDYDYQDGYVVLVYQLDPLFKIDFDLIKAGKYSRTSHKFQELFPETVTIVLGGIPREELSLQYRIFNRTTDLVQFWEEQFGVPFSKDMELWNSFDIDNETLNLEKVKENV